MLVTKTEFAKMCGVSRQAIHDAVSKGMLVQLGEGRQSRIDTGDYKSIQYLRNNNPQRKGPAEKAVQQIQAKAGQNKSKKKPVDDGVVKDSGDFITVTVPKSNGHSSDVDSILEIAERLEIAKTEKMEEQVIAERLKNAKMRGDLIDKERTYNSIFLYLDKLHSNIERLADSYLSDLGGRIIDAKKVLPEHRMQWKNEVMSQIDAAKVEIANRIKEIQQAQL